MAIVTTIAAGTVVLSGSSGADVTAVQGEAYGYYGSVSLFGGPAMVRGFGQQVCTSPNVPVGCVPAASAADSDSPAVALPPGGSAVPLTDAAPSGRVQYGPGIIFTSGPIEVSTVGTTGPGGSVTSSATINNTNTSDVEILTAGSINATCTASETSITGTTTINGPGDFRPPNTAPAQATLKTSSGNPDIEGDETFFLIPVNPTPNLTVEGQLEDVGDSFRVVFNEQITESDGSLTVNAVHEYLLGPTAIGEVIIGHVNCGITATAPTTTSSTSTTLAPTTTSTPTTSTTLAPTTTTSSTTSTTLAPTTTTSSTTSTTLAPPTTTSSTTSTTLAPPTTTSSTSSTVVPHTTTTTIGLPTSILEILCSILRELAASPVIGDFVRPLLAVFGCV
ncbi:MAG: choice-of-anchor P family protein [Acidimicrobiales bacterium]